MNNFTKEELEDLEFIIRDYIGKDSYPVYSKIKTMIDNYCEHKDTYPDYNYTPERCFKCLEILQ